MKDRILNGLMLAVVAAALILSLGEGGEAGGKMETAQVFAENTAQPAAAPHPVESYRQRRQEARAQEQEALLILWEMEEGEQSLRTRAGEQLLSLVQRQETELALEAALAAKGYAHALCIVDKERLTILLEGEMTEEQLAFITHMAWELSGIAEENIRISPC